MSSRTAVIYHYFEKDRLYMENLIFFLATAILPKVDTYVVLASSPTVDVPEIPGLTFIPSRNWNSDFGGYIDFIRTSRHRKYGSYVFVNSSVRGPFIPPYLEFSWINAFLEKLKGDVHLVGATINTPPVDIPYSQKLSKTFGYTAPHAHVQTTAYAMTREALDHLIAIGFYDVNETLDKNDVVISYEMRLSQEIIRRGWNIDCLLPVYSGIDYRSDAGGSENFSSVNGDVLFNGAFFGRTLSPFDSMFIKTNRNMISPRELCSHTFTYLSGRSITPGMEEMTSCLIRNCLLELKNEFTSFRERKRFDWLSKFVKGL